MHRLETYVRVLVMIGAASHKKLVSRPSRSQVPDCFKCLGALETLSVTIIREICIEFSLNTSRNTKLSKLV